MEPGKFAGERMAESNPKWKVATSRLKELYQRPNDIRSPFARDYNRILHCTAYRRLKHKTQVFFATSNDHICTRIEHVSHVASVSHTIAEFLGLNTELTAAIAIGHDVGHAPFGHAGEEILREIARENLGDTFWHERNSLRFVDKCETLPDDAGVEQNLHLTYAVRDGIVSHCGEVDDEALVPRDEAIRLEELTEASAVPPFTWEGCVVKVADKVAYLGRDIEDALTLSILTEDQLAELQHMARDVLGSALEALNTTVVMHEFIIDLCTHSDPQKGIRLSALKFELMKRLRKFSQEHIYQHERLRIYRDYARLIIQSLFKTLLGLYQGRDTLRAVEEKARLYPNLAGGFRDWLWRYSDANPREDSCKLGNEILYRLGEERDYRQAIMDYISGMTDAYAIKAFGELTSF
ncbi:MAG TPA: HD domain-containing protein [Armatimonadota bacterium]|jgi:dGTPase|nr:HD domain-containing protein [Armatimonadota bacterium]